MAGLEGCGWSLLKNVVWNIYSILLKQTYFKNKAIQYVVLSLCRDNSTVTRTSWHPPWPSHAYTNCRKRTTNVCCKACTLVSHFSAKFKSCTLLSLWSTTYVSHWKSHKYYLKVELPLSTINNKYIFKRHFTFILPLIIHIDVCPFFNYVLFYYRF